METMKLHEQASTEHTEAAAAHRGTATFQEQLLEKRKTASPVTPEEDLQ